MILENLLYKNVAPNTTTRGNLLCIFDFFLNYFYMRYSLYFIGFNFIVAFFSDLMLNFLLSRGGVYHLQVLRLFVLISIIKIMLLLLDFMREPLLLPLLFLPWLYLCIIWACYIQRLFTHSFYFFVLPHHLDSLLTLLYTNFNYSVHP